MQDWYWHPVEQCLFSIISKEKKAEGIGGRWGNWQCVFLFEAVCSKQGENINGQGWQMHIASLDPEYWIDTIYCWLFTSSCCKSMEEGALILFMLLDSMLVAKTVHSFTSSIARTKWASCLFHKKEKKPFVHYPEMFSCHRFPQRSMCVSPHHLQCAAFCWVKTAFLL